MINRICAATVVFGFCIASLSQSCRAPRSEDSHAAGVTTDLALPGEMLLYYVEKDLVHQLICPKIRPYLRATCRKYMRAEDLVEMEPRQLASFEEKLRALIDADLKRTLREISEGEKQLEALEALIVAGGAQVNDLKAQRVYAKLDIQALQGNLAGIQNELANLPNTLIKLKESDLDYEITQSSGLYKENQPSMKRFHVVFLGSALAGDIPWKPTRFGDCDDVPVTYPAQMRCDSLTKLAALIDRKAYNELGTAAVNLTLLASAAKASQWGFGPKFGKLAQRVATRNCQVPYTADGMFRIGNRVAAALDDAQKLSASLAGDVITCRFKESRKR